MRKIISFVVCLALLFLVGAALPVQAAGSAHMSLSASPATVYRGDAFTVTVSLTNDQPVSNGGVVLSYDSSAFEFVGGSCNVSGATLAQVSAANNGGVFALQTDAVVSGTIFTIQMKVKSDAAFGTYTISGSPSLSISCSLSGTSVTVACSHSFANCTNVDGSNHQSTCTVCGETKTDAHTWDGGTVTKAATCKDTGVRKLTCTGCGTTKEETVAVTNNHSYGSWGTTGSSGHSRTCSVCGKKETVSHTWNSGTVLEAATCQKTGSKKLTCTACGETKTETIAIAAHDYSASTRVDDTSHTHTCEVCDKVVVEAHTYDEAWEHDENWHFQTCTACGHQKDQAAHVPGPKATETTDQICTVCERILQPKGEHVHSFAAEWSTDDTGHWHACSDCNEKDSAAPHTFDDDCDVDCSVCGMTREPLHAPAENWSTDETGHWYACGNCEEKVSFAPHTPGEEATISSPQLCTVCAYEIAPVLPHDHVFDADGTLHRHTCACGEVYEADADSCKVCAHFPWWIVCILEVILFGAVIAYLLWKMKQGKPTPPVVPAATNPQEKQPETAAKPAAEPEKPAAEKKPMPAKAPAAAANRPKKKKKNGSKKKRKNRRN